jgi:hypothetical protein
LPLQQNQNRFDPARGDETKRSPNALRAADAREEKGASCRLISSSVKSLTGHEKRR